MRWKLLTLHGLLKLYESLLQVSIVIFIAKKFPGSENLAMFIFAMYTPSLIFSIFLGSIVDRKNKNKLLLCVLICSGFLGFISGFIFEKETTLSLYLILLVSFSFGIVNYLYKPLFKSITKSIYKGDELKKTNSLQSTVSHSTSIIGAFLSGLIMTYESYSVFYILAIGLVVFGLFLNRSILIPTTYVNMERKIFVDVKYGLEMILSTNSKIYLQTVNCMLVYSIVPLMNFYLPYKVMIDLDLSEISFSFIDSIYSAGMVIGGILLYKYVDHSASIFNNRALSSLFLVVFTLSLLISNDFHQIVILSFLCGISYYIWGISISEFQESFPDKDQGKAISSMNLLSTITVLLIIYIFGNIKGTYIIESIFGVVLIITGVIYYISGRVTYSYEIKNRT